MPVERLSHSRLGETRATPMSIRSNSAVVYYPADRGRSADNRTETATSSSLYEVSKRTMDFILGFILLLIAAPLIAVAAALVKLTSPGPAFFVQHRPGRNGRMFPCYKMRTMRTDSEQILECSSELSQELSAQGKVKLDPRITPIGRVLRKASIDELPQLLNVIRGEMSLVGPRPLLPSQVAQYGSCAANLLSIRPGLTGLWQVSGRSDLEFSERIELDMQYVARRSMLFDLSLLMRTIKVVLLGKGAY